MKRILIVDDHAIVRKGLRETILDELGSMTFGEASSGHQALELIATQHWDLVLLDINLEGLDGLNALAEIRRTHPKLPVLIVSMYPEAEFALQALKQGAAGYINKQSASEELVVAVKKVLEGGRYVSAGLADRLVEELQRGPEALPHAMLSVRELQVMCLIAEGKTLKTIATLLSISVKTVVTYHGRLLKKMGMTSDVELTRYALAHALVK